MIAMQGEQADPPLNVSLQGQLPSPSIPCTAQPTVTTNDRVDSAVWTFSPPTISFGAVSELTTDSGAGQAPGPTTPPSFLTFDAPPLPFKGLPLSVAQWTFTSRELQEIVSRAIRLSARESYIRLLSLHTLDDILPQESRRLDMLKMMTQAKYRFQVHRRTMLLQALKSFTLTATDKGEMGGNANIGSGDDSGDPSAQGSDPVAIFSKLTSQLAQTTATLDELATDLITISSHQSQISAILATHWGSALAIALRKLNSSFTRRTQELHDAGKRITMLEAEVAEAWTEADRLAGEMDALEKFADSIQISAPEQPKMPDHAVEKNEEVDDNADLTGKFSNTIENEDITDLYTYADEAVIGRASVVLLPSALDPTSEPQTPIIRTSPSILLEHNPSNISLSHTPTIRRVHSSDAISTRTTHSTHSAPSSSSRRARVDAARKRSSRASLASLRLPSRRGSRTGSSAGHGNANGGEKKLPPLPDKSESWAAASRVPPFLKPQRRRSEWDGGPGASVNGFWSQSGTAEHDGMEIEIVPRRRSSDPPRSPSSNSPIPTMWLQPDAAPHAVPKARANTKDNRDPIALPYIGDDVVFTNKSASAGMKIRTLIRHGSESLLKRTPPAEDNMARSGLKYESDTSSLEVDLEERHLASAPDGSPASLPNYITASRFRESFSSFTPDLTAESHSRDGSPRVLSGFHSSRLARFKTMTKRYSLSFHRLAGRR